MKTTTDWTHYFTVVVCKGEDRVTTRFGRRLRAQRFVRRMAKENPGAVVYWTRNIEKRAA